MNSYFFCCLYFDILYIFEGFLYIFLMNDSEIHVYRYLTYGFFLFFTFDKHLSWYALKKNKAHHDSIKSGDGL